MELTSSYGRLSDQKCRSCPAPVSFSYADGTERGLQLLRQKYALDEVAGDGPEVERLIRLMSWVYRLSGHVKLEENSAECNALHFIRQVREEDRQIDGFKKNVVLNELYLSMGYASRQTHLLSQRDETGPGHYVTSVYSRQLRRWLLMDPDFGVYLTDEGGLPLGVTGIRRAMVADQPLKAVHVGRSWLGKGLLHLTQYLEGSDYIWFLAEYIFMVRCPQCSRFNQDALPNRVYFELRPDSMPENPLIQAGLAQRGMKVHCLDDEELFWQAPGPDGSGWGMTLADVVQSEHIRRCTKHETGYGLSEL